ncbi:MAG: type II secretion system protein [bacterium]|nr:type II secretion system protein [bacterium]
MTPNIKNKEGDRKNKHFQGRVLNIPARACAGRLNCRGFTLVELIVSVAIFSIVMVVSVGAILYIISANRQAQAMKAVMNNLNFTLESMARNLRMGSNYHCGLSGNLSLPANCETQSQPAVVFRSSSGGIVSYELSGTEIVRGDSNGRLSLTSEDITVETLSFFVEGAASDDNNPARILVTVGGKAKVGPRAETRFNLQTYVVQRYRDETD